MSDTPAKFQNFLSRLKRVTEHKPGKCWSASCPAHPHDEHPSLSVNIGETGNLVVSCHSTHGCTAAQIVKALGMSMADLFAKDKPGFSEGKRTYSRPLPSVVYPYHYADGRLAYECCRYEPKDFAQRRPNPKYTPGGSEPRYIWNLLDIELVLYRLPWLLDEMKRHPDRWVTLVEGEKCSDALEALGIVATTHALGSDNWLPQYAQTLAGRNVAIFYDLDPYYPKKRKRPGQAWAIEAARDLHAAGCRVRVCRPPECAEDSKDDVADYIARNSHKRPGDIKRALYDVIQSTRDYYPGWERDTGFAAIQHRFRDRLALDGPADMNDAFDAVKRRLDAAVNGVRLDSLADDLGECAAWCQWLAERLSPKLTRPNIVLDPSPVVESTQSSEPKGEPDEESEAAREKNASEALCLPAQTAQSEAEFVEPEII